MVTAEDIKVLKEVYAVLKFLEIATKDMSGEKYCTASRAIPLMHLVANKMDSLNLTTTEGQHLLSKLKTEFSSVRRFGVLEQTKIFAKATILDPRFKKLHFKSPIIVANAVEDIKTEVVSLCSTQSNVAEEDSSEVDEDELWALHTEIQKATEGTQGRRSDTAISAAIRELAT